LREIRPSLTSITLTPLTENGLRVFQSIRQSGIPARILAQLGRYVGDIGFREPDFLVELSSNCSCTFPVMPLSPPTQASMLYAEGKAAEEQLRRFRERVVTPTNYWNFFA
jgi:hypothetical protein